jgi:hypothetical protein
LSVITVSRFEAFYQVVATQLNAHWDHCGDGPYVNRVGTSSESKTSRIATVTAWRGVQPSDENT